MSYTSTSSVPGLIEKIYSGFTAGYDITKKGLDKIYKIQPTRFNFIDRGGIKTLPPAVRIAEGANAISAGFSQYGKKRFQVYDYAIMTPVTYQILRDNLYPEEAPKFGKNLFLSQISTMNRVAASVINFATSTANVGLDGMPFASMQHPVQSGFNTNLYTTSSDMSVQLMRTLFEQTTSLKDEAGKIVTSFYVKNVVVNQTKIWDARVVLDSLTRPGTGTVSALEINPANGSLAEGYSMNQYLANNVVLVKTNVPGTYCFEREKLKIFQLGNPQNFSVNVSSILSYAMDFDDYKCAQFAIN